MKDKLGREVATVKVYNRSDVDISEDFPVYGVVTAAAKRVSLIPAEVATLWTDPNRWEKSIWTTPPITADMPEKK